MIKKRAFWSGTEITEKKANHENIILVFGSNPHGNHGFGMAKIAHLHWGAKYYNGRGRQGDAYALVTKNLRPMYYEKRTGLTYSKTGTRSVPLDWIKNNIKELYSYCHENPELKFLIPYILNSKNLNGYSTAEIVELFINQNDVPINVVFHTSWKKYFIRN